MDYHTQNSLLTERYFSSFVRLKPKLEAPGCLEYDKDTPPCVQMSCVHSREKADRGASSCMALLVEH